MVEKLTPREKKAAMAKLKGWSKLRGREAIKKTFVFADFNAAFRVDEPCRHAGRKNGPSSGMGQCL